MNIHDVDTATLQTPTEIWPVIFTHQLELELKYTAIEIQNGFYAPDYMKPPSLDDRRFQNWIKNKMWRVTEELAESMEVARENVHMRAWRSFKANDDDHFIEEVIDALHFLVAVTIPVLGQDRAGSTIQNRSRKLFFSASEKIDAMAEVVWDLGIAANVLKNKPWKLTHVETDQVRFVSSIMKVWDSMFILLSTLDLNEEEVYKLYFKKQEVNKFRQRSNY